MHDLTIRNGTIVDGAGAPAFPADLAIDGGRIVEIGTTIGPGRQEIDAKGRIVTPGWIDIHTHYDGQATWDPHLTPSGGHGVTTLVMGNCGVGFAPVQPGGQERLIGVVEGVEDIPGSALSEGINWAWESFPDYLDALAAMPRALDIAAQIPHSAVRLYVMGDRATNQPATADDIARMAGIVEAGARAGAVGFSTSRTILHRTAGDGVLPGTNAGIDEMHAIGRALGRGVFQMISDFANPEAEFDWMTSLSRDTGLPVHYSLVQHHKYPDKWRHLLVLTEAANAGGAHISALVGSRPIGMLICLDSKTHPFSAHPAYMAIAHLPLAERVAVMRDPEFRWRLLAEKTTNTSRMWKPLIEGFGGMYRLGDPPDYEPTPDRSVAAIAACEGKSPSDIAYDLLLEGDGKSLLYFPYFNYAAADFSALSSMILHPDSLLSLGDGGAHCGLICDASMPTYLLTHWVQGRTRGPRLSLEQAVHMQTARNADAYGFRDRGRLAVGLKADINVIDLERLHLDAPRWANDLPANGRRLLQDAHGYDATIVAGQITWRNGKPTGALPGKLVRG